MLVLCLAACGPTVRSEGTVDAQTPEVDATPLPTSDAQPGVGCEKMDVLFVIDNSGSMEQEQQNLIANFPTFISVLDMSGLDYRVGVTTTGRDYDWTMQTPFGVIPQSQDGGHNGKLLKPAACNMTKRWIDKTDPNPAMTFSCVANVGIEGPSREMPLAAIRDAFTSAATTNAGFRRADALLAIVILTDENDCSYEQPVTVGIGQTLCQSGQEPVATYVSFLDTFTGNHSRWATAVIAGKGPGSCSSSFGDANEATRLKQFVNMTGTNGHISSICAGDLSIGLAEALMLFESACDVVIF